MTISLALLSKQAFHLGVLKERKKRPRWKFSRRRSNLDLDFECVVTIWPIPLFSSAGKKEVVEATDGRGGWRRE